MDHDGVLLNPEIATDRPFRSTYVECDDHRCQLSDIDCFGYCWLDDP
ncbi:MAG: hypothetical protein KGQ58_03240 [Proteobacteria bacterium]|nr:hypothetical protein [Pseudomonadota bacterium]